MLCEACGPDGVVDVQGQTVCENRRCARTDGVQGRR